MYELIYLVHANIDPHKLPATDQKMNQMPQVNGGKKNHNRKIIAKKAESSYYN